MVAAATFATPVALANGYSSPSKIATTGPGTLVWTGQGGGSDFDTQCTGDTATPGTLLWIFTTDGGSVDGTPSLTVNGDVYSSPTNHGGSWHFLTGWYETTHPPTNASVAFDAADTGNGDWVLTISHGCPPAPHESSITTTQLPHTATVGDLLKDQATLLHTSGATGTITFTLVSPGGTTVDTEQVTVTAAHTVYTTPTGYVATATGTYYWTASYSGDLGNKPASSGAHDEPVVVGKATPSLTTTQDPSAGLVGITLNDGATLSHGYNPTGHITFFLDDPNGNNVFHETVDVNGNGNYSTTDGFTAYHTGTWQWHAEYTGDDNNNARHTAVGDEPVVITSEPVTPHITTTQMPATAKVGDVLKDKATLTGTNNATGTITFELFDPNGHSAFHETVTVSQYHTEYTTPNGFMAYGAGTWYWVATYSGDGNNNGVSSGAHEEPVIVAKADPAISTTQHPASAVIGATIQDSATLTGYHPTGTITFFLNDPNGTNVYHETVDVTSGNGTYSTVTGFAPNTIGTWHWWAEYNGDANNNKVHSVAADEPVVITQGEQPTTPAITTTPLPTSAVVGATLKDKATLSGGNNPTGTITFTLYSPAGAAVHTETVTVSGNGSYTTASGHAATLPVLADAIGVWHWKAAYSGDQNNKPVSSDPADEPVNVAGGEVLAATAMSSPVQAAGLGLVGLGLIAMMGALAWRRRLA